MKHYTVSNAPPATLSVIHDDLLHPVLGGNKLRKLDALLPALKTSGVTNVVSHAFKMRVLQQSCSIIAAQGSKALSVHHASHAQPKNIPPRWKASLLLLVMCCLLDNASRSHVAASRAHTLQPLLQPAQSKACRATCLFEGSGPRSLQAWSCMTSTDSSCHNGVSLPKTFVD